MVTQSPVKDKSAVDILDTVQRNRFFIPYQIGVHALSVGCYYDIGKGKVVKVLQDGYSLPGLGDTK